MHLNTLDAMRAAGKEDVFCEGDLRSVDFLLRDDGMGFTLSDVRCDAGMNEVLWYKNHWEANYIVSGEGLLEDLSSGQTWALGPGVIYIVGPRDRHRFRANTLMHAISIFNPPLHAGVEYDEDGSFEPTGDVPPGPGRLTVKRIDELRHAGRERVITGGGARTIRALLQEDRLGFTLSDVRMTEGYRWELWYKNHWEANYILEGVGKVTDLGSGESWPLKTGTLYIVGPDDRHCVEAESDLHLISIFNPPLLGNEQHDDNGTLPSTGPLPPGMK